jgi:molecular chaperone Hsp33
MIRKDIFNRDVKSRLKAAAKDRIHRFFMADRNIRGAVVHATLMVNEMRANHQLGPLETLVLGQAYIAGALMCASLKGKDRVSIHIQCSGPVKGLDVEANVFGEVRGYLKVGQIVVPDPHQVRSLSGLFGAGFLTVTRYLEDSKTPYSGRIPLEHGTIAEDLAVYFLKSEQIPTGFKLSVHFDENQEVTGAGGIFLQAMPGADPDQVAAAEEIIRGQDSLGQAFAGGVSPQQVIETAFSSLNPKLLDQTRVEFFCRCAKDRMQAYLQGLSPDDRADLRKNGPFPLEVRCHHCGSVYHFNRETLQSFLG